ncbi:MAG: protease SohB, partial [Gammaproteobacteria bacterium]
MGFLSAYLLFLAKAATAVIAIVVTVAAVIGLAMRSRRDKSSDETLDIKYLNSELHDDKVALEYDILEKADKKQLKKKPLKPEKGRPRLFVLHFDGDIDASETDALRRQITAILQSADSSKDKVLLCLESPGGVVHGYGLAASQLNRLKQANINLTVAVDKVAA